MKGAAVCCRIKTFRLTWDFYNYTTTVHADVYTIYTSPLPVGVEATAGEPVPSDRLQL